MTRFTVEWPDWPDLPRAPYHAPGKPGPGSNPVAVGRKFCSICGRWRHLLDFSTQPSTGRIYSACAACYRARQRKRMGGDPKVPRRIGRDPVKFAAVKKAAQARYQRRLKEDPARWAERLEIARFNYERRVRATGREVDRRRRRTHTEPRTSKAATLPAGPFREWFADWQARHPGEALRRLALSSGVPERSLWRVLFEEQENISVAIVDEVLTAAGEQWLLNEMYPLDEEQLAA